MHRHLYCTNYTIKQAYFAANQRFECFHYYNLATTGLELVRDNGDSIKMLISSPGCEEMFPLSYKVNDF